MANVAESTNPTTSFLDRTVLESFRLSQTNGEVGIEIEVESDTHLPNADDIGGGWLKTTDGSLRGRFNAEYVLNNPVHRRDVPLVLDTLNKACLKLGSKFNDSIRAGTHIHINCQEMTLRQIATMATLYFVAEDALINFSGVGRKGNHFCLRAKDADFLIMELTNFFSGRRALSLTELFGDTFRYASINFSALAKYGSLEFRSLRSTQDMSLITTWVNLLLCLKDSAINVYRSPRQIIEQISFDGSRQMMRNIFGDLESKLNYEDYSALEGARTCQDLAYCRRDW